MTGDISITFNQIEMVEKDQKFHRFLWRFGEEASSQPLVFQWKRVVLGDTCSPDIAMYGCHAIRMLADVYEEKLSVGARVLKKNSC